MTVSYQYQVASSTSGGFTRLLLMWRGSLYKLIYRELVLFLVFFGAVSAVYRHLLTDWQKKFAFKQSFPIRSLSRLLFIATHSSS